MIGYILARIAGWLDNCCRWVPQAEYIQMVNAHSAVLKKLYEAESEIVRLRKKCGEDYKGDYPYLL